jgi:hypothetical protein
VLLLAAASLSAATADSTFRTASRPNTSGERVAAAGTQTRPLVSPTCAISVHEAKARPRALACGSLHGGQGESLVPLSSYTRKRLPSR